MKQYKKWLANASLQTVDKLLNWECCLQFFCFILFCIVEHGLQGRACAPLTSFLMSFVERDLVVTIKRNKQIFK